VKLRPKEDDPEEQRQNADEVRLGSHVLTKTKLRPEWLQGQVNGGLDVLLLRNRPTHRASKVLR